ncbi:hypothetical protein C8Q79DRAFT_951562 [Trametes meyenii]|nr:hypothetical protein C8Q79DRAFT_951562 [Trametes meyenii]
MASAQVPTFGKSQTVADSINTDFRESTTLRFEWTLRGLKNIFESSKGEAKSKVTKSPKFGDGRWQILFYPNAGIVGTDGQTFVSLYLACEPTAMERENAVNGKWSREGLFNFNFEIRNLNKTIQYNYKEAHDHSFYYPGAQNWGWAQFARRDAVYYQPSLTRQHDAFVITCSITSVPATPAKVPSIPRYTVPRDLLETVGGLLDDPVYSDVEFVLPQRGRTEVRKIYAARRLLKRVEYFNDMFGSGFAEGASIATESEREGLLDLSHMDETASVVSDVGSFAQQFDDSDYEEEDDFVMLDNDHDTTPEQSAPQDVMLTDDDNQVREEDPGLGKRRATGDDASFEGDREKGIEDREQQSQRNTRPKLSHPSSPRTPDMILEQADGDVNLPGSALQRAPPLKTELAATEVPGPKKVRVVVRDVAYTTYRAVLYYIYTDMIVFAPLSSTFLTLSAPPSQQGTSTTSTPATLPIDNNQQTFGVSGLGARANQQQLSETAASSSAVIVGPKTRREWIREWERNNPGRPRPPSAKSVYRLADRLDLQDLKERAFQHIIKSLTVHNVANEAFSAFSASFEGVRKVEIAFMFRHWMEVRKGALTSIGQQLRLGKLPGFEEVWPMIIQNLIAEEKKGEAES